MVERLEEPSPAVLRRSLALVQIVDRLRVRLQPGYDPSFETALAWIRESRRPTFWFVHLMDVHSPYVPPHPLGPRFGADPSGGQPGPARRNRFGWRPSVEAYLAEIRFADLKIGRLRHALERLGRFDQALTIVTSDHGENLLDHEPHFSHGSTLYDATLRILALLRAPGHDVRPAIEPVPLENVDLLPTLFALLDWDPHEEWEGRSFWPHAPPARPTYAQLNRDFAIRTTRSKLVLRENGGRDWYRLDEDPGERRASILPPDERRALERELEEWIAAHATDLYEGARSIEPGELSPELQEKLRALGYIDD
jgi:arylsulfatase A-like enzyme